MASAAPLVFQGTDGPGKGKHLVFIAGDHEYRSEESLPALARIQAKQQGFKCTVLFSQDPDGTINPNNSTNVPGMHLLGSADLVLNQFRFRDLNPTRPNLAINATNATKCSRRNVPSHAVVTEIG